MNLAIWIKENTIGSDCVVEFGAMFFEQLSHVSSPKKIGIEVWQPYIDAARYHNCIKINGDFRKFEELLHKENMDCAMFVDTLEHLSREDAFDLIKRVKQHFNKIILMIPEGNHPLEEDVTGYGAHEYQTHRSTWYEKDVKELGFDEIVVDPNFHDNSAGKDNGCIFAVWRKK